MEAKSTSGLSPLTRHFLGLAAYYVVMLVMAFGILREFPQVGELFNAQRLRLVRNRQDVRSGTPEPLTAAGQLELFEVSSAAMLGSLAVTVPVAWIYVLTRRRKGFTQSVVHTLLILPVTVSAVVILIQDSLALAFSLAGVVAAVRFRNTLEDTKDAVYIFVATGVGMAAATGNLVVGAGLTVIFNLVVLILWWTEFGRSPAKLEGSPAVRRLERSRAVADAGGDFVIALDREVLSGLSPEQLEAVTARAWRRLRAGRRFPFNALLRVHTLQLERVQAMVESALNDETRRWELSSLMPGENGWSTLEYLVRMRSRTAPDVLVAALRARCAPEVIGVEVK